MTWRGGLLLVAVAAVGASRAEDKPSPADVEFFETRVRAVLVNNCYGCHSANAKKLRGGLRLDTREGTRSGGASGPAVVPGDPARSLLVQAVRQSGELKMPPEKKLTAAEITDLEAWVKRGAPDPRGGVLPPAAVAGGSHWSLQPVRDPPVPAVKDPAWPLAPVDRFILAAQEGKGLKPVPPADRRTLIRRAAYDLTGLPPTPEEVEAFLADESPQAFERVVDRLLASPAYGERWGRHWLDVVRYADTAGDNSDYPVPQMYRYRNWVIDAVNRDLPYDQFVRQQLAGDLLPAADEADRRAKLIATGYLANARRFGSYADVGEGPTTYPWHLTIEDTIDNLGRTFLGLTINCCRCHDHKFDPLSQADYYALYGFFQSTRYPWPGIELDKVQRHLVPLAPPDRVAAVEAERRKKLADLDAEIKRATADKAAADRVVKDAEKDGAAEAKKRADELANKLKRLKKEREDVEKQPLPYETVYAVAEGKTQGKRKVGNACIQVKGDPERQGPEVPRRFPTVLGGQTLSAGEPGSGRRELAGWITDPKNPLTARVMANRIWQWHFGRGIVPTPSDFGKQGQPPTHPELLDWLAARFAESGWSVKAMHRLLMRSRTYQLASTDDPANAKIDVGNELLWRFPRRRLDAEAIRDTLLLVSGALDWSPGGPHPFPAMPTWNFTQHNPFKAVYESDRRSVYLMTQRIQRHPFLALFDGPDPNASTSTRVTSTTPLQALFLMNDPFVHARARGLAARLLADGGDDGERVGQAYRLLYGRPPTAGQTSLAADYLSRVRDRLRAADVPPEQVTPRSWESLARALFLSNEFVYVD